MILKIKIHPDSGRKEVIKKDEEFEVYVKSPAENNKANIEVISLLSKYFNTSYKNISIKGGLRSSKKIVEINENRYYCQG